ncbi:MAG: SpoIIE family protein phosphatase [Blautia sp.]|nr:SpoIIE family protein phosphatase [Blautia sp.]
MRIFPRLKNCLTLLCILLFLLILPVNNTSAAEKVPARNSSGILNRSLSVDPSNPVKGYLAILYNNQNGLPTSEANAIAQTGDGFIWIGSYSGLIRYDGNTFERMSSSLGISSVITLYVDSGDRLWIGTNDSGLIMMERDHLQKWTKLNGTSAANIRAITEDENGVMYIATASGIAMIDPDMSMTLIDDYRLADVSVRDLRIGNDGLIYGLTQLGDLFSLQNGEVVDYLSAEDCRVKGAVGILPDPRNPGYLYLGTEGSIVYYGCLRRNFGSMGVKDIAPLTYVERFEYVDGQIWVCAGNGIGCVDSQGFRLLDNVPMNNSVTHMMTDYEGNLWFASTRQGVMKVVANHFSDLYEYWNLPDSVVNSTCMYDNQLFIATDSGLTVLDNNGIVTSVPLTRASTVSGEDLKSDDLLDLLSGVRIRSIIRDSKGRLWISAWRKLGLLCYDQGEVLAYTPEDGLFSDRIRVVCERRDGSMMVANTGGVNLIKDGRVTAGYGEDAGIANTEILTIANGMNDDMILGTDGGGIYIISNEGLRHIGREDGLASEIIMRVKYDPRHNVFWIVTSNSLACMTPDYQVTTLNNFPYSNNFDIYLNNQGEAWVINSDGVYILPAEELLMNEVGMKPLRYTVNNGLPCIATANSYSELTEEGDLYLSGSTGVAKINIEGIDDSLSNLKAAVPYIYLDGKRMYPDKDGNYTIPSKTRRLMICGYVFHYSLSDLHVSYYLEGFDTQPTTVSSSELAPIEYMNLSGGIYHFVMEVTDSLGRVTNTLSFRINKEKAYYEQTWFYVLGGIFITGILAFCINLYIRRKISVMEKKHQEEKEKERISTELSMAKEIQSRALPNVFPPFPDRHEFIIFASMDTAKEVGGDFYDFFLIDDDHLCLVIADVSGKGVPAALFMMKSRAVIRSSAIPGKSAGDILTKANKEICANNDMDMFVTVWLGILEISSGKVVCANAGHEYPAICRNGGSFELYKDKHGFVLGGMEGIRYREYELQLEKGDKLFVYTDGVPEATEINKELFGTGRMLDALNTKPDGSPQELLPIVRAAVDDFVQNAEQFDDLTMLCLEYKGPDKPSEKDHTNQLRLEQS